jgi:hypothetical protein
VAEELDQRRVALFALAVMSGVRPEDLDPALADGPTTAERLFIASRAEAVAQNWQEAGVLGRPRTVLDLTSRELLALAMIHQQVRSWLRKTDDRPLSDVLKVVPPRVAENVAYLMNWAGWADLPGARFRLEDDCDDA